MQLSNACQALLEDIPTTSLNFIAVNVALGTMNGTVLLGNLLVIYSVLRNRILHTTPNYIIASLALSDLLIGILVLPFSITQEVLGFWLFGYTWCQLWLALDVWLCTASIYNLVAVSLDRYLAVSRPIKYKTQLSCRIYKLFIPLSWIISFLICSPPLVQWSLNGFKEFKVTAKANTGSYVTDGSSNISSNLITINDAIDIITSRSNRTIEASGFLDTMIISSEICEPCLPLNNSPGYVLFSFSSSFFLPSGVLFVLNVLIYLKARRAKNAMNRGFLQSVIRQMTTLAAEPLAAGAASDHDQDGQLSGAKASPSLFPNKSKNSLPKHSHEGLRIHRGTAKDPTALKTKKMSLASNNVLIPAKISNFSQSPATSNFSVNFVPKPPVFTEKFKINQTPVHILNVTDRKISGPQTVGPHEKLLSMEQSQNLRSRKISAPSRTVLKVSQNGVKRRSEYRKSSRMSSLSSYPFALDTAVHASNMKNSFTTQYFDALHEHHGDTGSLDLLAGADIGTFENTASGSTSKYFDGSMPTLLGTSDSEELLINFDIIPPNRQELANETDMQIRSCDIDDGSNKVGSQICNADNYANTPGNEIHPTINAQGDNQRTYLLQHRQPVPPVQTVNVEINCKPTGAKNYNQNQFKNALESEFLDTAVIEPETESMLLTQDISENLERDSLCNVSTLAYPKNHQQINKLSNGKTNSPVSSTASSLYRRRTVVSCDIFEIVSKPKCQRTFSCGRKPLSKPQESPWCSQVPPKNSNVTQTILPNGDTCQHCRQKCPPEAGQKRSIAEINIDAPTKVPTYSFLTIALHNLLQKRSIFAKEKEIQSSPVRKCSLFKCNQVIPDEDVVERTFSEIDFQAWVTRNEARTKLFQLHQAVAQPQAEQCCLLHGCKLKDEVAKSPLKNWRKEEQSRNLSKINDVSSKMNANDTSNGYNLRLSLKKANNCPVINVENDVKSNLNSKLIGNRLLEKISQPNNISTAVYADPCQVSRQYSCVSTQHVSCDSSNIKIPIDKTAGRTKSVTSRVTNGELNIHQTLCKDLSVNTMSQTLHPPQITDWIIPNHGRNQSLTDDQLSSGRKRRIYLKRMPTSPSDPNFTLFRAFRRNKTSPKREPKRLQDSKGRKPTLSSLSGAWPKYSIESSIDGPFGHRVNGEQHSLVDDGKRLRVFRSSKISPDRKVSRSQLLYSRIKQAATTSRNKITSLELKAAMTVSIVVGCFILCWLPFSLTYLIEAFEWCSLKSGCLSPQFFSVVFWMGYSNSAINPVIYALFSRELRTAFAKTLGCASFDASSMSGHSMRMTSYRHRRRRKMVVSERGYSKRGYGRGGSISSLNRPSYARSCTIQN